MVPNDTNIINSESKQLKHDFDYYLTSKSVNETKFVIFLSTYITLTILAGNDTKYLLTIQLYPCFMSRLHPIL